MANIINGTDTGSGGLITTGDSSDELQLQTAETERITLTNTAVVVNEGGNDVDFRVEGDTEANLLFVDASADKVSIGTDSPNANSLFTVDGSVFSTCRFSTYTGDGLFNVNARPGIVATPSNATLLFGYQDDAGGQYNPAIGFRAPSALGTGQSDYSNIIWTTTNGAIAFGTGTGGSYTERMRLDADGLKFNGDTAAANALDDYEEGTWTPEMRPTSGGSYSWSIQAGRYIKVGSLVTLHGTVAFETVGTVGTGQLYLQNLPFANLNTGDSSSRSALLIGRASSFATNNPISGAFVGNGGSTQLELYYRSSSNGDTLDLPASAMAGGAIMTFSISYTTA